MRREPALFNREANAEKPMRFKKAAILAALKNRLTPMATRHHVVKGTGEFNPQAPWQAA